MGFFGLDSEDKKKSGGLGGFGQGIGLKYNGFGVIPAPSFSDCGYIFSTNKDFVILNSDVTSYLNGDSHSINIKFNRSSIGTKQALFASSDNSLAIYLTAANEIQISHYDTTEKLATTSSTFTSTSIDYDLSVVFDTSTPSNSKILVNGVDETLTVNTLTSLIDATTNDYYLGSNGSSLYLEGTIKQFSINSATETLAQHITWNENLISPASIFSNIVNLKNIDSDPLYDRVNNEFAALDIINPVVSNKRMLINAANFGLRIPDNAYLNNIYTSAFTVICYVKLDTILAVKSIFSKYDVGQMSFAMGSSTTSFRADITVGGVGKQLHAANTAVAGEWVYACYVMDGASSKIYVNGVDSTSFSNVTGLPDATTAKNVIGRPETSWGSMTGDISFLEIVDKAINDSEAVEGYNLGNPISTENSTYSANLVYQMKSEDLEWDGLVFNDTDAISGLTISSQQVGFETDLKYGGTNVSVSRNLTEFDKECNDIVSKGDPVYRVFHNGQSNALGTAAIGGLPSEYLGSRNDMQIWDNIAHNYVPLDSSDFSAFGSDFSYTNKLVDFYGKKIYIDKFAVSATRLAEDTGDDWNTLSTGEYFDDSQDERDLADTSLANNDVTILGEIWNQHENDCQILAYANAYETNLTNYITKRRLSYPNIKIIIVLVHADLPIGTFPYKATVKTAQLAVAAAMSNVVTIDQDAFSSNPDNIHRDAAGYEALGNAEFELLKI